jgi:hypothetical protein
MKIPGTITAGDSVTWNDVPGRDNLGNLIDSSAWALTYEIKGPTVLTIQGVASPPGWKTSLTALQTKDFVAGVYYFQAYATNSGLDRVTLGSGQFTVTPNLAGQDTPYDGRSQNQKDLDAVQNAMRAMISGGAISEYTVAGRSVRKMPMADLIAIESRLKLAVSRERKRQDIANGLGNPSNIFVRFK